MKFFTVKIDGDEVEVTAGIQAIPADSDTPFPRIIIGSRMGRMMGESYLFIGVNPDVVRDNWVEEGELRKTYRCNLHIFPSRPRPNSGDAILLLEQCSKVTEAVCRVVPCTERGRMPGFYSDHFFCEKCGERRVDGRHPDQGNEKVYLHGEEIPGVKICRQVLSIYYSSQTLVQLEEGYAFRAVFDHCPDKEVYFEWVGGELNFGSRKEVLGEECKEVITTGAGPVQARS